MIKDQRQAYIYALSAVLAWSTVASAFKIALAPGRMDPIQLLCYSNIAAVLIIGIVLISQKKVSLLRNLTRKQILFSAVLGICNPFIFYLLIFKAYSLLPAQVVQPINFSWGLMLAFLSVPILKQKLYKKDLIAGLTGYSGVVVVSLQGDISQINFDSPLGLGLTFISTIFWALYWLYNTKNDTESVCALFIGFCTSLPLIVMTCYFVSDLYVADWKALTAAAYVGVFEMGLTFVLWLKAMKLATNSAKISNLIFIAPFISLILLWLIIGEKPYATTVLGLILISLSLVIQKKSLKASG